MWRTWIAQIVDLAAILVLSQENALALAKISQIQKPGISKKSAHKNEAAVL